MEYDQEKYRQSGEDVGKYMAKTRFLKWRDQSKNVGDLDAATFAKIHDAVNFWNGYAVKWAIVCRSCFGSGVGPGLHRLSSGNFITGAGSIISNAYDMWWCFESCATHTGTSQKKPGEDWSNATVNQLKCFRYGKSYKETTDKVNNFNANLIKKTYALLQEFMKNHKDRIRMYLVDDQKEQWDNTINLVINDIKNNGRSYFCLEDYNEKKEVNGQMVDNPNFTASDVYFDQANKKYRINDGIIGYIKYQVFDRAFHEGPWMARKKHNIVKEPEVLNKDLEEYPNAIPMSQVLKQSSDAKTIDDIVNQAFLAFTSEPSSEQKEQVHQLIGQDSTIWDLVKGMRRIDGFVSWYDIMESLGYTKQVWSKVSGMPVEFINQCLKELEDINELEKALSRLRDEMKELYNTTLGEIVPELAVQQPTFGCSGQFTNEDTRFMQNPDLEENRWLISDSDLETLAG